MNRQRALIILAALITLSAVIYAISTPPKLPPIAQIETAEAHNTYLPAVFQPGPKLGYAWAWWGERGKVSTDGVSWYYRHFPAHPNSNPYPTLQLIPMVHCPQHLEVFEVYYPRDYDGFVLWLNEPVSWDQCPMSPRDAVAFLDSLREVCRKCKIIGPQMEARPEAFGWFLEFMSYSPDIDGVGIHHYSFIEHWVAADVQLAFYQQWGLPIWVTEFGTDDPAQIPVYLELYAGVERVAYFAPYVPGYADDWPYPETRLFDDAGGLTDVGRALLGGVSYKSASTPIKIWLPDMGMIFVPMCNFGAT